MELLQLIYRPEHFYVIHVDYRAATVRQELNKLVHDTYHGVHNIRILPAERSFAASWGSWFILRSQLEGYSELLQMGMWDFAISLSGSDLPLRNVDDLAAALAQYRGRNIMKVHKVINQTNDLPMKYVWHSCNGHVYNVTSREPREQLVYSHAGWTAFTREFTLFVLSGGRGDDIDQFHFYLQTSFIPDETFMGSLLHISPFRDSVSNLLLHFLKPFVGTDANNLCRHFLETDSCGQGPADFQMTDQNLLRANTHQYFFARKFSTKPDDAVRREVIQAVKTHMYEQQLHHLVSATEINTMAEIATQHLQRELPGLILHNITRWQALPRMLPRDQCCAPVVERNIQLANEFIYWLDLNVNDGKTMKQARAKFAPLSSSSCFPAGHLKLLQLTTRAEEVGPPENRQQDAWKYTMPSATEPAGGDIMWLHLLMHTGAEIPLCLEKAKSGSMRNLQYVTLSAVPSSDGDTEAKIMFDASLYSPGGQLRCREQLHIKMKLETPPHDSVELFSQFLQCGIMEPGLWTVELKQHGPERPYVYRQKVFLADMKFGPPKDVVPFLWSLEDVMLLDQSSIAQYYTYHKAQKSRKSPLPHHVQTKKDIAHKFHSKAPISDASWFAWGPYFLSVSISVIGLIIVYYLCLSNSKSIHTAVRRIVLHRTPVSAIVVVVITQVIFYHLSFKV